MVGFLDLEANVDSRKTKDRTVFDIIEVGFLSENLSLNFHSFVKPIKNNGVLFKQIEELCKVTQSQVDNGLSFEKAFKKIHNITCNFDTIYTWGSFDKYLLLKNRYQLSKESKKQLWIFCKKIVDLSEIVKKQLKLKSGISLVNFAYILGINAIQSHKANDDCNLLRAVYFKMENINQQRLLQYKKLDSVRTPSQRIVLNDLGFELQNNNIE